MSTTGGFVHPRISFTLNAEYFHFVGWLDGFATRTLPISVNLPHSDNTFGLIGGPLFRDLQDNIKILTIRSFFTRKDLNNPNVVNATPEIAAIKFEIFEPSHGRVRVESSCSVDMALPYYLRLLLEIADIWIETKPQIEPKLDELRKHPDYWGPDRYKPDDLVETESTEESQEPNSRNLVEWFDWYHANKGKHRIKMQYIADKTGFALSTVYKEHSNYMDERGISPKSKEK